MPASSAITRSPGHATAPPMDTGTFITPPTPYTRVVIGLTPRDQTARPLLRSSSGSNIDLTPARKHGRHHLCHGSGVGDRNSVGECLAAEPLDFVTTWSAGFSVWPSPSTLPPRSFTRTRGAPAAEHVLTTQATARTGHK
jgi:hypothetical protein